MRLLPSTVAAALVALLALAVEGARRPQSGGAAQLPVDGPIGSLDPVRALWPAEASVVSLLYDAPLRRGPDGRPRPLLLSMPGEADGGKTLRFRVREHAIFNDGAPLRAAHVVASLRRLGASQAGWLLAMVDGAAEGRPPSGISADGERIVQIELARPASAGTLLAALTTPQAGVVRSASKAARGVGSGPFALLRRRGADYVLRANRDYFHGPPFLASATVLGATDRGDHIRRFQLGSADGSLLGDSLYGERSPRGAVSVAEGPPAYLVCLVLNGRRSAVSSPRRRRAVSLALSRARIAGGLGQPAGLPGAKAAPRRDLAGARREVAASGGEGGAALVLLVRGEDPVGRAAAPLVARDVGEAGLRAETVVLSGAAARARLASGSWDMRIVTVAPPSPGLVLQLGQLLALGGQSRAARRLLARAGGDRQGELARATRALEEGALVLPLFRRAPRLHHDPRLRNVSYDDVGRLELADIWSSAPDPGGG